MPEQTSPVSPLFKGRVAGAFYLLTFLTAIPVALVSGRLVVSGDVNATAAHIMAHQELFGVGFAFDLLTIASYVTVTVLLYNLFAPVNKAITMLAALFSLVGLAIQAVSSTFYLACLVVLGGAPYLRVFDIDQRRALASLLLELQAQTYNVGLVFFGCYCILIGYLILKSIFLPRTLGVLMTLAGLGWLTFLSPPLAHSLSPYNLAPGVIGEGSLTLFLLIMGVNVPRWNEQAGRQKSNEL